MKYLLLIRLRQNTPQLATGMNGKVTTPKLKERRRVGYGGISLDTWLVIGSFILLMILPILSVQAQDITPSANIVTNNIPTEHVVWDRIPIEFIIPVGQERMLTFPGQVDFHNTDQSLTTDKISVLNNNGTLYIKAKKAFDPVRVPIILKKTGAVVLVDFLAKPDADDTPVEVVMSQSSKTKASKVSDNGTQKNQKNPTAPINYITLMRYAIQHLYGPERLMQENPQLNRTPMYTAKSVNLFYNTDAMAMPLISWRGGDLYVTAVLLKNLKETKETKKIFLDPRKLIGSWLAISFYPIDFLTPKDTLHDRTTIFLISSSAFNEALHKTRGFL